MNFADAGITEYGRFYRTTIPAIVKAFSNEIDGRRAFADAALALANGLDATPVIYTSATSLYLHSLRLTNPYGRPDAAIWTQPDRKNRGSTLRKRPVKTWDEDTLKAYNRTKARMEDFNEAMPPVKSSGYLPAMGFSRDVMILCRHSAFLSRDGSTFFLMITATPEREIEGIEVITPEAFEAARDASFAARQPEEDDVHVPH